MFGHRLLNYLKNFFPLCKRWPVCCLCHHFWQLRLCLFLHSPSCHFSSSSSSELSPSYEVLIYYPVSVILARWKPSEENGESAKAAVLEVETRSTISFFSLLREKTTRGTCSVPLTQDGFNFSEAFLHLLACLF